MTKRVETIGILGAGKLGIVLSQLSLKAGYSVMIAGSSTPNKIQLSISILAPGAQATTAEEVASQSDIVILALPLGKYRSVPKAALDGKLVIDAMNYWWEVDGIRPDLVDLLTSSSEIVQSYLKGSRIVKALNHMGYHHLHDETRPEGTEGRKAIAIAGDDERDVQTVARFVNTLGFDPVMTGPLASGVCMQPGSDIFSAHVDKETLLEMLQKFPVSPYGKKIERARYQKSTRNDS